MLKNVHTHTHTDTPRHIHTQTHTQRQNVAVDEPEKKREVIFKREKMKLAPAFTTATIKPNKGQRIKLVLR